MDEIQKTLLEQIAGLHEVPAGAYNIRANGASISRNSTAHIDIVTKEDKQGIDIIIKPGTKKERDRRLCQSPTSHLISVRIRTSPLKIRKVSCVRDDGVPSGRGVRLVSTCAHGNRAC